MTSKVITFSIIEGCDEFTSWKKNRREYVRTLGHSLLVCSENEIIQIFDSWETLIKENMKIDRFANSMTSLLAISLLHYFNRSYDQIKEYIPFITRMLESKSRKIICAASQTLRFLSEELSDNIDFLRDLVSSSAPKWLMNIPTRYSALRILLSAGKFLLPSVFEVTSNNFHILWSTAICDDIELRVVATKVIDIHLNGLPNTSVSDIQSLFNDCISQMKLLNATSHGPVLICRSLLHRFPDEIDVPLLINSLIDLFSVRSEVLIISVFSLLYDISRQLSHLYTPDTVRVFFNGLISNCSRYPNLTQLFEIIDDSIKGFNPVLIPVSTIVDFLRQVVKYPKFRSQQQFGFTILQTLFKNFKDVTVPASFFLDAEPSPAYVHALRMRMALFNDTKATLLKYFSDGLSQKATQSQIILSLYILKYFDSHLFQNKEQVFSQIRPLRRSPSDEVRLLIAGVLPLFDNQSALDDLLFLALFDSSKIVRAAAVKELRFPLKLAHCDMLPQILSDPSFKVKRNAIPLIASVAPHNPLQFYVPISSLVEYTISSIASSSNLCTCARISTLMPLIAEHFIQFCPAFIPQLTKICFSFLKSTDQENYSTTEQSPKKHMIGSNNYENPSCCEASSCSNAEKPKRRESIIHCTNPNRCECSGHHEKDCIRISEVINRDLNNDGHALITNKLPFDKSCTNLLRIFQIENQEWIDIRDANLFLTLEKLAPHLLPFINDLIPIFIEIFSLQRTNKVYMAALDAITEIVVANALVSSVPSHHPDLVPVLMLLLNSKPCDEVAVKILKLMGTFGITSFPNTLREDPDERDPITDFDFKSPSFYSDFTMTALLKLLNEPHSSIFEAVTSIFVKEAHSAVKFLPQIIAAFSKSIYVSKGAQREELFKQLEIISYFCGAKIEPFVEQILPHIRQNMTNTAALRIACILSYFLKTEIISGIQPLFQNGLRIINNGVDDLKVFETLMTFCTSAVVFQNQPLDLFVVECERSISLVQPDFQQSIVNSLITVVQLSDASFECAHIARICTKYMNTPFKNSVFQLLFSLGVYAHLSPDCIDNLARSEGVTIPMLDSLKDYQRNKSIPLETFLNKHSITVNVEIPDYVPLPSHQPCNVFADFPPPQFNNTAKWLEDLSAIVVSESPSLAIRSCHKLAINSPPFRSDIFPIAFLSCWIVAKRRDQRSFSHVLQTVFETDQHLNPAFLRLAELLVRCGRPLNISSFVIASACHSPALALRFLVRHIEDNPHDFRALELMLTLNMRLGRLGSSRGILKSTKLPTAGSWYEKLGQWEEALENYSKSGDSNSIIRCLAKLERWDEVRALSKQFNEMPSERKKENAIWFAWAFYRADDLQKVSFYVNKFGDTEDPEVLLFREIFLVASNQNKAAKSFIEKSMQTLVKDCSVYSALNANLAAVNLTYANCLVELNEAIDMKQKKVNEIPTIWLRRLNSLTGDSYAWMKLVEIRNLALSITENKLSYLKLLSILTKERQRPLVDAFWKQMKHLMNDPEVQLSYHKMLWARYEQPSVIESLHILNILYQPEITEEAFIQATQGLNYFIHDSLHETSLQDSLSMPLNGSSYGSLYGSLNEVDMHILYQNSRKIPQLTTKLRARFFRTEGSWRSQLYQKNESMQSLTKTIDLFRKASELSPDDYRNWAGFAYAASRAIDDISFVSIAINGFLRVSQLRTSNNLEYLCPLFSLFFRYGTIVSVPNEIVNLGPEIIFQVLPQIVCQINHPDEGVKNIVHELLSRFSEHHFEALVFSLHLLIRSEDEAKVKIARDLLFKLSSNHSSLAVEAEVFVDGLLRAAVTWYEVWMNRLDAAFIESRRNFESGTKMLIRLFESRKYPQCQMDMDFNKILESPLATCANTLAHFTPTEGSFNMLWTQLKRLYEILRDKFRMIDTIQLSAVSSELSTMRNFMLSIPGTYSVIVDSPRISKIDPTLPILTTQQHPRLLFMTDASGSRWKFLLKGNEDLRLDQRIMQFFNLINSLLTTDKVTKRLRVTISKYAIIPIAPNAGLISWVTGADTMHQLVMDYRKANSITPWAENEALQLYVGDTFDFLNSPQKAELWDLLSPKFPATELREMFWEKAPDAVSWLKCIDQFVVSTALMSMAGYVIGLGDRHPCNIMIQRQTGHVVHIDFGDSFEIALNRERMPEKVPFRLTRMLVKAFGVSGIEEPFRGTCESILRVLRDNKSSIIAQLEIFVHEPIFVNKDNGAITEGQSGILDRVIEKLSGNDPKEYGDSDKVLNVEEQVDKLIKIASDPYRYVLHYIGWCQFW
ncbi:PIKK family atypical protein kinase [Tritrichomonas foetus]|uniref:Serine/threonine-protein kinase TOR n=1 Tax=Tritrichomonas foetus TaxID=1144522 RepID=A0A1J4JK04_9EUKA|nr:PIKK family atypical protein kinase [Tritrichomonas foetus]|eukprot:OHS99482.1 PIKK family atypical protein kinase [Tritrichomonas foetus]